MWAKLRKKFDNKSVLLAEQELKNVSIHFEDDKGRIWIQPYSHFESAMFLPRENFGILQINYHGWEVILQGINLEETARALAFHHVETIIQKTESSEPPKDDVVWVTEMEVNRRNEEEG